MLTGPLHNQLPLRLCPLLVPENCSPNPLLLTYFRGGAQMIYGAGLLENRASQVVGAAGGRSIAYLCVCTRSSLSPLKLCAAFVFAEEDINHQKSSAGISHQKKTLNE